MHELVKPDYNAQPNQAMVHNQHRAKAESIPAVFLQPISVSISDSSNLKLILVELARQVKVDLQLDANIQAKIFFTAKNKPFIEIIEHICDIAGLRYTIINHSLRIQADTAFVENYSIQSLNICRSSENRISISTDVFSDRGTGSNISKGNQDNGSNSAVTIASSTDFWLELENNLKIILSPTPQSPLAGTYSLHKQGGIISINGTARQHRLIKNYLDVLRSAIQSQVLIEAKIIEVILKDEFRGGINWNRLKDGGKLTFDAKFGDIAKNDSILSPGAVANNLISFGLNDKNFSGIMMALEEFGSSRTLSSPRLTVMNNQTAILKVAQNQVYFRLKYDKQYNTAVQRESVTVSSDIQTVPIGFVMSVQPSIDRETGEVVLFLRPTISKLNQSVNDPAVDIVNKSFTQTSGNSASTNSSVSASIPVVEVREIDSVLRLKDGDVAIMGGLMEIRSIQNKSKVPVIGDINFIKELFSSETAGDQVVELVILIKATIIKDSDSSYGHNGCDKADKRLQKYIPDPRPFN